MTLLKIPIPSSGSRVEVYISAEVDSEEQAEDPNYEELLCRRLESALGGELQRFLTASGYKTELLTD